MKLGLLLFIVGNTCSNAMNGHTPWGAFKMGNKFLLQKLSTYVKSAAGTDYVLF